MGVATRIYLPPATRIRDVAHVIALLCGFPATLEPLGKSMHVDIPSVTVKNSTVETCADIILPDRQFFYHFEYSDGQTKSGNARQVGRGMLPTCTAENIAIGVGLVRFFGGTIDFNDSDDKECNLRAPARKDIHAVDGRAWESLQRRKYAVRPLTTGQIARYSKYAAYTDPDDNARLRRRVKNLRARSLS